MSIFELMGAPLCECLVLVGIHTYLGIHVLRRRVIFVDLALAQIAALGTMVGFLFGVMPDSTGALLVSMVFTFFGAALFALTRGSFHQKYVVEEQELMIGQAVRAVARVHRERIPQEAVIGLVYAITAAVAVLVVDKTRGGEHIKEILVGSILWVTWKDVATAAAAYALVGAVHFIFRRQFFLISENPEEAARQGLSIRLWDFFFYVTFGFVIAFSTRVAGVLLVFVFLVAPAIMAFLITNRLRNQLVIGWIMGTLVTMLGLLLSYVLDLPCGPSVVAFYGVALALGSLFFFVLRAESRPRALGWVGVGAAALVTICSLFYFGTSWLGTTALAQTEDHQADALRVDREATAARAAEQRRRDESVLGATLDDQGTAGRPCARYLTLPDADARLSFVRELARRCRRGGLKLLLVFLADPDTPLFYRVEAAALLKQVAGQDFGFDPQLEPLQNRGPLDRLKQHIEKVPPSGSGSGAGKAIEPAIRACLVDC